MAAATHGLKHFCSILFMTASVSIKDRAAFFLLTGFLAAGSTASRHLRGTGDQLPTSRRSIERMVGSGSEPRYLPVVSYTSCAGFVLYFFGAATAPAAVPRTTASASAVLMNMISLLLVVCHTSSGVYAHLSRARP